MHLIQSYIAKWYIVLSITKDNDFTTTTKFRRWSSHSCVDRNVSFI